LTILQRPCWFSLGMHFKALVPKCNGQWTYNIVAVRVHTE